jgi:methyltransferase-like protein
VAILTDRQFIQTMITVGRIKRRLEDDENQSNTKIRRITIKNEPEQVINFKNHTGFYLNYIS